VNQISRLVAKLLQILLGNEIQALDMDLLSGFGLESVCQSSW